MISQCNDLHICVRELFGRYAMKSIQLLYIHLKDTITCLHIIQEKNKGVQSEQWELFETLSLSES